MRASGDVAALDAPAAEVTRGPASPAPRASRERRAPVASATPTAAHLETDPRPVGEPRTGLGVLRDHAAAGDDRRSDAIDPAEPAVRPADDAPGLGDGCAAHV